VPGQQDQFLINPYGLLFDEVTASSLVKIEWVWSTQATSGRAIWIVLGIANPPLLTSDSDGSTLLPSASDQ
jgi:hypothetical protein